MPPRHLDYSETPPIPVWGSIPLDIYLLEEWDIAPPAEVPEETPDQKRRRLVRQFLNLGVLGRKPYNDRTLSHSREYSPLHPTQSQIDTILRPLRPDSLRCFARFADNGAGLWVRTCYNQELEQEHCAVWHEYITRCQTLDPSGLVFDDADLFQGISMDALLEIFPERVTNSCGESAHDLQAEVLAEMKECDEGDNDDGDEGDDDDGDEGDDDDEPSEQELFSKLTRHNFQQEICRRRYSEYHYACVTTHIFIEDKQTQIGGGLLHVFLDDCGNVVRQTRDEEPQQLDNYSGTWSMLAFNERSGYEDAEIGPAYLPAGVRGPPYGQGTPRWLQLCMQDA